LNIGGGVALLKIRDKPFKSTSDLNISTIGSSVRIMWGFLFANPFWLCGFYTKNQPYIPNTKRERVHFPSKLT